jgi:hypothetical protein
LLKYLLSRVFDEFEVIIEIVLLMGNKIVFLYKKYDKNGYVQCLVYQARMNFVIWEKITNTNMCMTLIV